VSAAAAAAALARGLVALTAKNT